MELVVDTSIVVAALLRSGTTRSLLFNPQFKLFSPERVETEIVKNKEKFKQLGNFTEEQFFEAVAIVMKQMEITAFEDYKILEKEARIVCKRDESDWPFVALALKLDLPIWSADPDILEGQRRVKVVSTPELLKIIF